MKQIFCIIMFCLAFAASATAQTDYNYSFYPLPQYTKIQITNKADSTKTIVPVRDSVSSLANVIVEKTGNRISIRLLTNISESVYDEKISFIGAENSTMMYRALNDTKELVYVNPALGIVVFEFQSCFDEPQKDQPGIVKKHCNIVRHIFGNNKLLNAPPSPAPSPQKPK